MQPTPHDHLFRAVFSDPLEAAAVLPGFLPDGLADVLDWSTTALQPGSFVDEALRGRQTDLVFSVQQKSGEPGLVYLLLEHQSYSDPMMAWRMLRYMVRLWDRWTQEHPKQTTLPLIFPIVLAQGGDVWSAPRRFRDLIAWPADAPHSISEQVPDFSYQLQRLRDIPDDELQGRALGKMALLLLKHAWSQDVWLLLETWGDTYLQIYNAPNGLVAIKLLLEYMFVVGQPRDTTTKTRVKRIITDKLGTQAEEAYMTLADQFRAEGIELGIERGREEGREEGIEEGREEGIAEGARKMFTALLRARFGNIPPEALARIEAAGADELERLSSRAWGAADLDGVFE